MKILIIEDKAEEQERAEEVVKGMCPEASVEIAGRSGDAIEELVREVPDILLTDLFFAYPKGILSPENKRKCGPDDPAGSMLVLSAIALGVEKVGVVTDVNHHDDAWVAFFLDGLKPEGKGQLVKIGESAVGANGEKDWKKMLERLLTEEATTLAKKSLFPLSRPSPGL